MGASYALLRAELRRRVGSRSVMALTDETIDDTIRDAVTQLASPKVHRHQELEERPPITTADGEDPGATVAESEGRYALPTVNNQDIWTIFSVRDTTPTNIRRLRPAGAHRLDEVTRTFGPPIYYVRWAEELEFDPIPNGVFNIVLRAYVQPFVNTDVRGTTLTGNCLLHDRFNEGVLLGAEWRLWMNHLQNPARGRLVQNQLVDWAETIISPYEGELDDMEDILAVDLTGEAGGGGYNG